jgi:hypothetical protein
MIEILLAIIAAELGFAVLLGVGVFSMEFYSLWVRYKAMQEEAGVTKIRLSPEEMEQLLSGKGIPSLKGVPGAKPVAEAAEGQHGVYA